MTCYAYEVPTSQIFIYVYQKIFLFNFMRGTTATMETLALFKVGHTF